MKLMGISGKFLKINNIHSDFDKDTFSFIDQTMLSQFNYKVDRLGLPKSVVKKITELDDYIEYSVKISTDTITEPIYIYQEGYCEYEKGYQRIETFTIWISKDKKRVIVFAKKDLAELFLRKLKRSNYLEASSDKFDFSKISELDNMDCAWGVWEDSKGVVKRIAKFGKGLDSEIDDFSVITTFYIDYEYGGNIIQLILSKDGRMYTSNNNLTKLDFEIIYNEIYKILKKEKN